jgi:predicted  nucleic acid-binding Zn-ribbon protein
MPHQCTDCGRTFDDGSTDMLSGCPDCGGNKFQYRPEGADPADPADEEPPDPPDPAVDSSVARTVGSAATAVRDLVGSDPTPEQEPTGTHPTDGPDADAPDGQSPDGTGRDPVTEPATGPRDGGSAEGPTATEEDSAQASARSEIVSPDELPPAPETATSTASQDAPDADAEPQDRPDLKELREELNDQFESIKVLEPGQYELNLMELYDREEYIIALQEDGKYTIQVPERWKDG